MDLGWVLVTLSTFCIYQQSVGSGDAGLVGVKGDGSEDSELLSLLVVVASFLQ